MRPLEGLFRREDFQRPLAESTRLSVGLGKALIPRRFQKVGQKIVQKIHMALFSKLRHKYHDATEQYGCHLLCAAMVSISPGFGNSLSPYAR